VVGGGIVGLCCAFSLHRAGAEVTLVERGRCGHGCTYGNTGWICPGLSAPLPAPGVMAAALRGMLRPGSPLLIRPVFGPNFLRWSWQFWRSCTPERYHAGLEATVALNGRTFELFEELRAAGVDVDVHRTGMVVAALSPSGLREYETMLRDAQAAGYSEPIELLDAEAVRRLEPAAGDGVVGGVYAPSERYVRPERLARALVDFLVGAGVDVREETEARDVVRAGSMWNVRTDTGAVEADAVVVAAGVWSRSLLARVGIRVPMEAAKGYSVTARGRGKLPRHALYLAEAKVGCSTFGASLRIAGIFDLTGVNLKVRRRRLDAIITGAAAYLDDWRPAEVELEWAGLRPYPPDGLPIIGAVPGRERLYIATGHGRLGITLAPATGEALSSLVLEGVAPPALEAFGLERFSRR
jgi:D-amino-acid dehydrogenase